MTRSTVFLAISIALGATVYACAAPVIIANRTSAKVPFQLVDGQSRNQSYSLGVGDLISVTSSEAALVRFGTTDRPREVRLDGNAVYFFGTDKAGAVEIARLGMVPAQAALVNAPAVAKEPVVPAVAAQPAAPQKPLTIPVKVLVDDDERTAKNVWKGRIARRVQAASDILERYCHARLEVVALEEWSSDNRITEFANSLAEFERKVQPGQARLAIGFTSQYEITRKEIHLGGTRGELHTHILIREWSNQIGEPERLEVLLHEVGHFLGACHSREQDSVMRPILGDRQARAKDFRIGYDPINTLAMSMLVEDYRAKPLRGLVELPLATRRELLDIYTTIGRAFPRDPTPEQYIESLRLKPK